MELALLGLISGEQLLSALFIVFIWGCIIACLFWGLQKIAPPEPWMKVGNVILVVLTVVVLINILLGLIGKPIVRW